MEKENSSGEYSLVLTSDRAVHDITHLIAERLSEELAKPLKQVDYVGHESGSVTETIPRLTYRWEPKQHEPFGGEDLVISYYYKEQKEDRLTVLEFERGWQDFYGRESIRDSISKEVVCNILNNFPDIVVPRNASILEKRLDILFPE